LRRRLVSFPSFNNDCNHEDSLRMSIGDTWTSAEAYNKANLHSRFNNWQPTIMLMNTIRICISEMKPGEKRVGLRVDNGKLGGELEMDLNYGNGGHGPN
jgi:hypothetical protein